MTRVIELMDYNYQKQVSDKNAQSNLIQILLRISKLCITNGMFMEVSDIIKRELPVDKKRYPGLLNLKAFLDVMSKEMDNIQKNPNIEEEDIHKIR